MGIFQMDVAITIGVDTLTVCNWENNLTNPRLKFLPKVFDFLGYNAINGKQLVSERRSNNIESSLEYWKVS